MYRGRFAPSPTGQLHFGSLVAALASYLDARSNNGTWLVRIEDLDPPREVPGAADDILRTLETFHLHWDGQVLWQSSRLEAYREKLQQLIDNGYAYACNCSRKRIKTIGGQYDNHCRSLNLDVESANVSIRARTEVEKEAFRDQITPPSKEHSQLLNEDFVIKRRDGLFAYQLAVVVDDIDQEISHIVRGSDLLESSYWQIQLLRYFDAPIPSYAHIPIAVSSNGQKLSKQNYAPAIDASKVSYELIKALHFLGHPPPQPLQKYSPAEILSWAIEQWNIDEVPKVRAQVAFKE